MRLTAGRRPPRAEEFARATASTATIQLGGSGRRGFAAGVDLGLPTGDERPPLCCHLARGGPARHHLNVGATVGGVSREALFNGAVTVAATPRITLVAESVVRFVSRLRSVVQVYEPSLQRPELETMRWIAIGDGRATSFAVVGAKWNLTGRYLLNTSILVRFTAPDCAPA